MRVTGDRLFKRDSPSRHVSLRRYVIFVVSTVLLAFLSAGLLAPTATAAGDSVNVCDKNNSLDKLPQTEINLVVDDSGSMFLDTSNRPIKLWSYAKYSLEVFAALLRPNDTLNVYLLSSYNQGDGAAVTPEVSLSGKASLQDRVDSIREMNLNGRKTPFKPVQDAYKDLTQSGAVEKWLVILTDGKFDGVPNDAVVDEIKEYISQENGSSKDSFKVAFLAIGSDAPDLTELAKDERITLGKASSPDELIAEMNRFANSIFRQQSEELDSSGKLDTDIDMSKIDVFSQGEGVTLSSLSVNNETLSETDSVRIMWSPNLDVVRNKVKYQAVPEKKLEGELVTFENVPPGTLKFDISESPSKPIVFTTPNIGIGANLVGNGYQSSSEWTQGEYTVELFVVDKNCKTVESADWKAPTLRASFNHNGETIGPVESGEVINLEKGEYDVRMTGYFPDNLVIESRVDLAVRNSVSSAIKMVDSGDYKVSELAEFPPESAGTQFSYVLIENGVERPFTPEEWAQIPPQELQAMSTNSNIEFKAIKGDEVGQVIVVPRAPEGDVFAADTGTIEFEVFSEYTANGEITRGDPAAGSIEIQDDISAFDRFMKWWKTLGWKLLLLLLLIILILGYIFKKRFSKKVKKRPTISGTPNQVGTSSEESTGKFRKTGIRRYMPFVADTATLSYVPAGVSGFRPMKLKAGPGKSMIVTNWKQIADKNNTEINGTPLDEETRRAPSFGASGTVTAITPQMTYEMTPNS